jgi:hypothetical protein
LIVRAESVKCRIRLLLPIGLNLAISGVKKAAEEADNPDSESGQMPPVSTSFSADESARRPEQKK